MPLGLPAASDLFVQAQKLYAWAFETPAAPTGAAQGSNGVEGAGGAPQGPAGGAEGAPAAPPRDSYVEMPTNLPWAMGVAQDAPTNAARKAAVPRTEPCDPPSEAAPDGNTEIDGLTEPAPGLEEDIIDQEVRKNLEEAAKQTEGIGSPPVPKDLLGLLGAGLVTIGAMAYTGAMFAGGMATGTLGLMLKPVSGSPDEA